MQDVLCDGAFVDWSNERYFRLYIRDTVTWSLWAWEARALFSFLGRKMDRAGVLDLGGHEPAKAIAAIVGMPLDVVSEHLPALFESGAIELGETAVVMPNYIEAQEAVSSDKQRQAESRGRRRDRARLIPDVTKRDETSRGVTASHGESHPVTPYRTVPSQAVPSHTEFSTSELASEPTENAHPHSAPTQPIDPAGTLPPTGKASAALGASSQASKAVSVAKRKPSKRKPSADAIRIAQRLYQAISAHSPDMFGGDSNAATEKRLLGWTVEIDRGLKAKDITVEDAILVVDYAHHIDDPAGSNGFTWHTNLLSGVAMRKQWKAKALLGKAKRWRDGKDQSKRGGIGERAMNYDFEAARARQDKLLGVEQ